MVVASVRSHSMVAASVRSLSTAAASVHSLSMAEVRWSCYAYLPVTVAATHTQTYTEHGGCLVWSGEKEITLGCTGNIHTGATKKCESWSFPK